VAPNRQKALIDSELPTFKTSRRDNDDPTDVRDWKTEREAPRREYVRRDSDAPRWNISNTEKAAPNFMTCSIDNVAPRRDKDLKEMEEPKCKKSIIDMADPRCILPHKDTVEPRRDIHLKAKELPK
jgi:hypothetical protein